jgi:hypothetical protein
MCLQRSRYLQPGVSATAPYAPRTSSAKRQTRSEVTQFATARFRGGVDLSFMVDLFCRRLDRLLLLVVILSVLVMYPTNEQEIFRTRRRRADDEANGIEVNRSVEVQPVISTDHGEPEEPTEGEPGPARRAQPLKTEGGRFQKAMGKWGTMIIGIAGLLSGYLISNQQQRVSKEISYQQQQGTKEIEEVRKGVSENQLNLQKNQFAASLINSLLNGSETERLLALAALEGVDETLWKKYLEILAQHDSEAAVRRQAIEGLGKKGDGTVRQTLVTIQAEGKTKVEREEAKLAEASLTRKFSENLRTARTFFDMGQWESAAHYFYETARYAPESQVESSKLALAKSHYEHGGYREAADEFYSLFSKF